VKVGEELDEIEPSNGEGYGEQYRPELVIEDAENGNPDHTPVDVDPEEEKIVDMSGNDMDMSGNQGKTGDLVVGAKDKNLRTKTQNSLKGNDQEKSFSQNKQDESFNIKNNNNDRVATENSDLGGRNAWEEKNQGLSKAKQTTDHEIQPKVLQKESDMPRNNQGSAGQDEAMEF